MPCYIMLCYVMLCNVMLCNVNLCVYIYIYINPSSLLGPVGSLPANIATFFRVIMRSSAVGIFFSRFTSLGTHGVIYHLVI